MEDYTGNILNIGDYVVFSRLHNTEMEHGTITEFYKNKKEAWYAIIDPCIKKKYMAKVDNDYNIVRRKTHNILKVEETSLIEKAIKSIK